MFSVFYFNMEPRVKCKKINQHTQIWERKFPGTKGPRHESTQEERKGLRTKIPGNFRFFLTFVPGEQKFSIGTFRSWEQKVLGTKSL